MSVILKQFDGGAIAPRDDAILYNSIITRNGILDGCTITHLGANQLKITAGRGIIKGRMFEVEEMTVNCTLASSGTQRGRMYLRMELSNMENPAQIKTVAADTLPELVQEEDCNYTNGIYELELCTYDVTDTLLSNLETTYEVIDTVFPVAKTLDDVNGVTDENVLAGAVAVKELSSDLASLNDEGAIKGLEVREGDGVYITYQDGADTVSKKLGSPADSILLAGGRFSGTGENAGNNARILLSDVFERVEVDYSTNSGDLYLYYYNSGSYVKNEKVTSGSKFVFYPNETYDEIRITMFQNSTLTFTYTITGYFQ